MQSFGALIIGTIMCELNKSSRRFIMLKFITNLFGAKKAEPVAPYKVETPTHTVDGHGDVHQVNSVKPVVNGRKAPAAKPKAAAATGNTPAKKKVSSGANKKSQTKK
jgi:hypothetical protein